MKTLQEHNDEVRRLYNSTKNGIECPNCKCELDDVERRMLFLTAIPSTNTICFNCGYTGTRLVLK
jgi:hypothetical protein